MSWMRQSQKGKNSVMKMPHEEFATWYSTVDFGDSPTRVEARAAGVSKAVKRLQYDRCGSLLDLVLDQPSALEGKGADLLRRTCRETDPAFPTRGNENELKLLAEIVLAIAMDRPRENELAAKVAGLICAALANGARECSSVTDLLSRARDGVQRQSRLLRRRPRLPKKPTRYSPVLDFTRCFDEFANPGDMGELQQLMQRVSSRISVNIHQASSAARTEREALERHIRLQDEELDLLWWASNGFSETLHQSFSEVEPGTRTLISATEAADRTQYVPGPCSILGLLERAGLSGSTPISIEEVINAVSSDHRRSICTSDVSIHTPLHLALAMKEESPDSDTWSGHWSARTKIDGALKRRESEIAQLLYHERLVLEAYGGKK